ncbi:MAG: tripartite tricarboxylate transporter TctB family protein [Methylocystaceae bacterium]|nr:tripartite tricarboxylate transporter TctB family protein [Methylocystaceae bacterium]
MTNANRLTRIGIQSLTSVILLVSAICALAIVDTQIQVFSLDDEWPNARSFPVLVLGVLTLTILFRLALNWKCEEGPIGPSQQMIRVIALLLTTACALVCIHYMGFLVGVALSAIVTSFALGERRIALTFGLGIILALIVTFGAREGLSIPLP